MAFVKATNNSDRLIKVVRTNVAPGRSIVVSEEDYDAWLQETSANAWSELQDLTIERLAKDPNTPLTRHKEAADKAKEEEKPKRAPRGSKSD